uniref:Reverse transcriptase domain-containing protein n=1 Tax=Tanacetum cinerariifolium TaxID=118510 RepID=A0A6L2PD69_TANCI|nr:reverse transcriptase domain-containing protein [Tanacetum cinerariifolium]
MYYDLRDMYWYPRMKKDMAVYKSVVHFGKKKKLAPRFVGPFEIIKSIIPVAYRLRISKELNGVHDTFHVSNLKKCLADPTLQIPSDEIRVDAKLNYVEEPRGPEFTWERGDLMKLKKNLDFAYLLWEDFVYQVEHKNAKKSNEMYYPTFTKVIIYYFMTKDPLIPRRNKFGVMLPIELTNEAIGNSEAYKEYYAVASGATPPKTKSSVRKTKSSSDTTITPLTAAGIRLSTSTKGKQPTKASKAKSLTVLSEVAMTEAEHIKLAIKRSLQQTHISQASGLGVDEGTGIIPRVPDVPTEESDEEIS